MGKTLHQFLASLSFCITNINYKNHFLKSNFTTTGFQFPGHSTSQKPLILPIRSLLFSDVYFHYPGHLYFYFSPAAKSHNPIFHEFMTKSSNILACFSPSVLLSSYYKECFYKSGFVTNFSTTIRSEGQVEQYLLTLTFQNEMLPSQRPMCVFLSLYKPKA